MSLIDRPTSVSTSCSTDLSCQPFSVYELYGYENTPEVVSTARLCHRSNRRLPSAIVSYFTVHHYASAVLYSIPLTSYTVTATNHKQF
jgi:hypothetical protein